MKDGLHIDSGGTKHWYKNGKLHREDGLPAIEYSGGTKHWYKNGKLHREDGLPAIEYSDGTKHWYKNGVEVTMAEVLNKSEDIFKILEYYE